MIKTILLIMLGVLIILLVLFIYCACVLSSMCSREEEKYEKEILMNG